MPTTKGERNSVWIALIMIALIMFDVLLVGYLFFKAYGNISNPEWDFGIAYILIVGSILVYLGYKDLLNIERGEQNGRRPSQ